MKKLKKTIYLPKSSEGFIAVFVMLMLPCLLAVLAIIYQFIFLIEFKSEFRFKCINESLILQKKFFTEKTNGLILADSLLAKLKKIEAPVKYEVILSDYPTYERPFPLQAEQTLAYRLNSTWPLSEFYLNCGIKLIKKEGQWHHKIIYSTSADKF